MNVQPRCLLPGVSRARLPARGPLQMLTLSRNCVFFFIFFAQFLRCEYKMRASGVGRSFLRRLVFMRHFSLGSSN